MSNCSSADIASAFVLFGATAASATARTGFRQSRPHQDVGSAHQARPTRFELLENHRRGAPRPLPQLLAAQGRDIDALETGYVPSVRRRETVDHPQTASTCRRRTGPITPTKPPGADRERCIVDRGFGAENGTSKPSTTSMQCSRTRHGKPWLTPVFYSCVTVALRCGNVPHLRAKSSICHEDVIKHPDDVRALRSISLARGKFAWPARCFRFEPTIDPTAKLHEARLGAFLRGRRRAHDFARTWRWTIIPMS